jgi:formamidopyrimidine-DNA glycosylase
MPELPDILLYLHALEPRVVGQPIERVRVVSPFLLRSVTPPLQAVETRRVTALRRLGKRIVFEIEGQLFLVIHLMIAGRFRWRDRHAPVPGKVGLAAIDFPNGTLVLTEAGTHKRASLHLLEGEAALSGHDPGGLEVLDASLDAFAAVLVRENHTLKRALTDPHLFSGIGNAYSDEILHAARLSPLKQTRQLAQDEVGRLYTAVQTTLRDWITRLRNQTGETFPEKVTAFRSEMAVHGRFRQPCPVCGSPVQRIVYATNEANYCARCQTGGRLLADRSLSRLLKDDWPRRLEDLENVEARSRKTQKIEARIQKTE